MYTKRITAALALTVVATGLSVAVPAQAATVDVTASADAHVDARRKATNYGSSRTLSVDGRRKHAKQAFLKFTVPEAPAGEVLSGVSLRLGSKVSSARGVTVHRTGNRWREDGRTFAGRRWNKKPTKRGLLGTSTALRAGTTEAIALDVDRIVPGTVLSLRLKTSARATLSFASSEAAQASRPVLRIATTPTPTPVPTPPVTSVASTDVLVGMSTDDYAARVQETGQVESHRLFVPSWNVASLVKKLEEAHARGVTPYWSMKFNTTWADAASGADDARFRELGAALARLDFTTFGSFHHEPRGDGVSTPEQLLAWSQANARAMGIVKPIAGATHLLGTTDNGFPWSSRYGSLPDAQLSVYYTADLLSKVDFLGADFYDGRTDTNPGEAAAVKMANFQSWATRIGFEGPLAVGEWNAVTAADIRSAGVVLNSGRWAIACLFNSAENNRADLPTDGSLGTPPSWVLRDERLEAFRVLLAEQR